MGRGARARAYGRTDRARGLGFFVVAAACGAAVVLFLLYSRALFSYAAHAAHAAYAHAARTFKEIMVLQKNKKKNRNPRSPGRRRATTLKQRRAAYLADMKAALAAGGFNDYSDAVSVAVKKRCKGRDEGRPFPIFLIKLADGETLSAPSKPQMLKKVSALVNSVRAEQAPLSVAAAEDDAEEPADNAAGEDAEDAEDDAADAGGFDNGGFGEDDDSDDMSDDSDDDAAAATTAAKQKKMDKLKKMLQDTMGGEKERPREDYKIFDRVKVTDQRGTYDAMVIRVDDIMDAAARTSSSRRFKVSFEDGTVSTVWPRSMALVCSASFDGGAVDLTKSSDNEEMNSDSDNDDEMDDAEEEGSSGSFNAV